MNIQYNSNKKKEKTYGALHSILLRKVMQQIHVYQAIYVLHIWYRSGYHISRNF